MDARRGMTRALQRPLPDKVLTIIASGERQDGNTSLPNKPPANSPQDVRSCFILALEPL